MRLHLVSLALLLLALCRPSSSTIYSDTSTDTKTTVEHGKQITEGMTLFKKATADKYKALDKVIGNSLYYLILKKLTLIDALPPFYKKALVNGVLCELADPSTITEINKVLYPSAATPGAPDDGERKTADGINCADSGEIAANPCYCGTPRKPQILCDIDAGKPDATTHVQVPCLKDALAALKKVAPSFFGDEIKKDDKAGTMTSSTVVPTEADDAKFYCEASSPKTEEAIKKVYAADATLWTMDGMISAGLSAALAQYGINDANDAEESCKNVPFNTSPLGKCVCSLDKGILLFCYPHLMGKKLQDLKYLECPEPAAPSDPIEGKFSADATTKPATLPEISTVKSDVTKTPTNNTDATTEPSSAATSSLLLAAAVVLLGQ